MKYAVFLLGCALASVATAAIPPAPTISIAATDIKLLAFNVTPVSGATRYELWFKANSAAAWTKFSETTSTVIRTSVAGHLLDWPQARYLVKACNTSGCASSNQLAVSGEKLLAMGYFKSSQATGVYTHGGKVAASADGKTVAVTSNETLNGVTHAGVVQVYHRTSSSSAWKREARLQPSVLQNSDGNYLSGDPLAVSGNGNLIAFGSWKERLPGAAYDNNGAVYLYQRSGTTWTQLQKIGGDSKAAGDYFGYAVKLDDAGKTLAVMHHRTGGANAWGTVDIYNMSDTSGLFVHDKTLTVPPDTSGDPGRCEALALSGDGQTLMRGCFANSSTTASVPLSWTAPTTNTDNSALTNLAGYRITYGRTQTTLDQTINLANAGLTTYTVPNLTSGTWYFAVTAYTSTGATSDPSNIASKTVATASGSNYVQVFKAPGWAQATTLDGGTGDGVDMTSDASGVIVQHGNYGWTYKRNSSGVYALEGKLSDFDGAANGTYRHVAISRDGKIAAIGNASDKSAGLGPIFTPYSTSTLAVGVVVVHERKSDGTWSVRRAIKPGSTNIGRFGHVVALGDNGKTLIVGAPRDPSKATGIDGDRNDKSIDWRGGVWIY
jgi:hypothetical protein